MGDFQIQEPNEAIRCTHLKPRTLQKPGLVIFPPNVDLIHALDGFGTKRTVDHKPYEGACPNVNGFSESEKCQKARNVAPALPFPKRKKAPTHVRARGQVVLPHLLWGCGDWAICSNCDGSWKIICVWVKD